MGDSTTVCLVVRTEDFESYKEIFEDPNGFESHTNNLVELTYYEVNYANLEFETTLQNKRIPYDKCWDSGSEYISGSESCRVLANGSVIVQEFNGNENEVVCLDDVITAYSNGQIVPFLESQKNQKTTMSWKDQELIMNGRKVTKATLMDLSQDALDDLVVEMSCELSDGLETAETEGAQEKAIISAEKEASNINNQGRYQQIDYLLNQGYLSNELNAHIAPVYRLPSTNNKQFHFSLKDECQSEEQNITGRIDNSSLGLTLYFDGYGDFCSTNDHGTPVIIEKYDGELKVLVYSDINNEEPSHVISLEGAKCTKRIGI